MKTNFNFYCPKSIKTEGKPLFFAIIFSLFSCFTFSQVKDTTKVNKLDEVLISAVRATSKTPVSFSNLDKKEIAPRNLGQDIPALMNFMPSVVSTSYAGNGIGYSGIRVRGSDATRVNVTINGISYNDSESQGTFWVNLPDFASSVQSLQLQRGVGTSTNGAGAFGASLNLLTDNYANQSNGEISNSYGSFNTHKHTIKFSTGLMNDHFELAGRLSTLKSDGYVDRASSDLKSYFLQGTYVSGTTLIKALVFGGFERTYQSWNGVDATTLASNRTYNSVGEKYSDAGDFEGFYENQVDNYNQDHAQLHWNEKISEHWNTNLAFHYTKGKGYYEEFVDDWLFTNLFGSDESQYSFLGLNPITVDGNTITSTDYTRRKWLSNDFYGTTFSANYKKDKLDLVLGGGYNKYDGKHFDQILWAQYPSNSQSGDIYDSSDAVKKDGNIFAKANYQLTTQLSLFGDLQLRNVHYTTNSVETGNVNDNFNFFNPKAGLTYAINPQNNLYFSYARANREPNRSDYKNGSPRPEKLNDFELGWRLANKQLKLNANVYYMAYKDQLILTGELDNVGDPIRKNSGDSYRLGLELDATITVMDNLFISPNVTVSTNKNKNYIEDNGTDLVNLGNTNIAYSPNLIFGNNISYLPVKKLQFALLTKGVGEQYLSNNDTKESKLKSYFVNDFNLSYEINPKSIFKSIIISGLVNNIFDVDYISDGADYGGGYVVYFPQAGINFLAGISLKF
ncbi:TonB-dependent receptor [Flavobacterium faecale]|uniref:TonB-dependent receptor n=1 Tax=Flavobacterium faecale TaxID=1355330 RepID=UPI003AAEDECA